MKKILFTAITLVAFSSASVANNKADKKSNSLNNKNIVLFFTDCEDWAMDQMKNIDPKDQMPPEDAHNEYRSLVELCDSH